MKLKPTFINVSISWDKFGNSGYRKTSGGDWLVTYKLIQLGKIEIEISKHYDTPTPYYDYEEEEWHNA